jgi:L-seryl-tRNA(Ser) seleniumtransferase
VSASTGTDLRRRVPSIDQALARLRELEHREGRVPVLRELRRELAELRELGARGEKDALEAALDDMEARVSARVAAARRPSLRSVINATGVVIHTNLGRAPLAPHVLERVASVATRYSNLEYDLTAGQRGDREVHAERRLRELLQTEAVLVVNNNAAAVMLAVNTFAEGREVVVSRGELVEIGGSFRIPDVLRKGGARLVEVGTTNRTRLEDYRAALTRETGLILKVHPSNFAIVGFTHSPDLRELVALARETSVPIVEDLGSGLLERLPAPLDSEATVAERLASGVDAVTFSGDKLLGGPQAGLIAGLREPLRRMRRNPLYRALRVDKLTLAALDAVLADHEAGARNRVPVIEMLQRDDATLSSRAEALLERLVSEAGLEVSAEAGESAVGGGALPTTTLPTRVIRVSHPRVGADTLAARLRSGEPPVIARIEDDRLCLDLRTVHPDEDDAVVNAIITALG